MALGTKEKQIGQHAYRVAQIPARQAMRLFVKLIKVVGPGVGSSIDNMPAGGFKALLDSDTDALDLGGIGIGAAVAAMADRIDEAQTISIVDTLAEHTTVKIGDAWPQLSTILDLHFAGDLVSMLSWIAFGLEVQFGDFLSGLVGQASAAVARSLPGSKAQ